MGLYVLKFGGSSVGTTSRIRHAASIVSKFVEAGDGVIVVTSAMQGVTNQLIELTKSFSDLMAHREYDTVISTGEQIAAGLLALCLCSMNIPSVSMNCWQIPIRVTGNFSNANINEINAEAVLSRVQDGIVPVITGFQGVSREDDVMTIGRGGSDTTACIVAHAVNADECLIYTDVDGVYTADPRIVLNPKWIKEISYDEMLALSYGGAKVMQAKSVLIAKQYKLKVRILSSFIESEGTIMTDKTTYINQGNMVAGIAHNTTLAKLIIHNYGTTEWKDVLNKIEQVNLIQIDGGDLHALVPKTSISTVKEILREGYDIEEDVGLITVSGHGFKADPSRLIQITESIDDSIKHIVVAENEISIVAPLQNTEQIVNILHEALFLDAVNY
ncbi:MAG: aspartate kinase [Holosporales bacterium]|jgi:aspartate kinase|nr:aspartate kinase [Holosporales bacterium]